MCILKVIVCSNKPFAHYDKTNNREKIMKTILSVGQCNFDHSQISQFITSHIECSIIRMNTVNQALEYLQKQKVDLVLVNRIIDSDQTDGILLVEQIKKDSTLQRIPIMLVSDLKEYQENAVELGAVLGFGKSQLDSEKSWKLVQSALD